MRVASLFLIIQLAGRPTPMSGLTVKMLCCATALANWRGLTGTSVPVLASMAYLASLFCT